VFKQGDKEMHVGRRDFIKTTTMAGMAATLPGTPLLSQNTGGLLKSRSQGMKKKLLFLSDSPASFESFLKAVKEIREVEFLVQPITVNYQKPQEVIASIQDKDADILLMCLPRSIFSYGSLGDSIGKLDIPMVLLAQNPDLILIDANFAAALRAHGGHVQFALSQAQAIEMVKAAGSPKILEGRRAVIFGRPFDSTSVPAHNLNEDYVYKRTGVRIQYRPMEELKQLFERTDEAGAREEAERWKKEAVQVVEPSDKTILDASRLYVLLRSIIEKESLSGISIDCLGLLFNRNLALPHPCLAFARLRDEGITAACEADVCGLVSSMFLQEVSRKPSFFSNVLSVNLQESSTVLSHCVAPLKLLGAGASPLPYRLRDYHGMGQGVVPEVEFPVGIEVVTGAFTKDLKSFVMWPGRIQVGKKIDSHTDRPATPGGFRRMTCANYLEVKIRDADRYLQNIAGIHHMLIAGNYSRAMRDALLAMNVGIIGPSDFSAPEPGRE
jgi:L-fucose isomerase-like protein